MSSLQPITQLLEAVARGDEAASERLLDRVYGELHRLAGRMLAGENQQCSLQATILVHDAWLALVGDGDPQFERRAHFFGAAARAMRRLLVDHARRRSAERRGGDRLRVTLADVAVGDSPIDDLAVLTLHDALAKLEEIAPDVARVVEMRYFAGLTVEETSAALGRSTATVKREWAYARAWLHERIGREGAVE